jgi:hypothetical protein
MDKNQLTAEVMLPHGGKVLRAKVIGQNIVLLMAKRLGLVLQI